ncbi:MAG: hydroxyisourate hydrolase [Pseudomonadota bacterium]
MGRLITHILNMAQGHPAARVVIRLLRLTHKGHSVPWEPLVISITNVDGRRDGPLLEAEAVLSERHHVPMLISPVGYPTDQGR